MPHCTRSNNNFVQYLSSPPYIGIIPGKVSLAAVNPERVRRERSRILSTTSTTRKELMPLLKILDFQEIQGKVGKEKVAADSELSYQMMGKYQMEGVKYLFEPGRKHAFLCPLTNVNYSEKWRNCFLTLLLRAMMISHIF